MAYVPRSPQPASRSVSGNAVAAEGKAPSEGALLTTGLFTPEAGKSKAIGTVKVKDAVTIPAGSYINLYENDRRKKETDPMFRLQIRKGSVKA